MFAPFESVGVAAKFAAFPEQMREPLMRLRQVIFDSAAEAGIGTLHETLKWGEPAFMPATPRIGTTIRINTIRSTPTGYALYVPCQTTLIATFRQLYGGIFLLEGKRAILFDIADEIPRDAVKHCVALALTYHRRRRHSVASCP